MNSNIRLKCSMDTEQINDRLQYNPSIIEIQLFQHDLGDPVKIVELVNLLKDKGIVVYLHHPMSFSGKYLDILSSDKEVTEYFYKSSDILNNICCDAKVFCVVHPHYMRCDSGQIDLKDVNVVFSASSAMRDRISELQGSLGDWFLWENSPIGIFSTRNSFWFEEIVKPLELPLCYDVSHAFMGFYGNNHSLRESLIQTFDYSRYYHVVDSIGTDVHDALSLGMGNIKWEPLKPLILQRDFIFEIDLNDYNDCTPMIESANYFSRLDLSL